MSLATPIAWVALVLSLTSIVIVVRRSGTFWRELARVVIPAVQGAVIGALLWRVIAIAGPDLGVAFPAGLGALIGYGVGLKRYFRQQATPRFSRAFWLGVGLLLLPLIAEAVVAYLCGLPNGAWICHRPGW